MPGGNPWPGLGGWWVILASAVVVEVCSVGTVVTLLVWMFDRDGLPAQIGVAVFAVAFNLLACLGAWRRRAESVPQRRAGGAGIYVGGTAILALLAAVAGSSGNTGWGIAAPALAAAVSAAAGPIVVSLAIDTRLREN